MPEVEELEEQQFWIEKVIRIENIIYVKDLRDAITRIKENEIYEAEIEPVSLEDIYLKLMGAGGETQ